MSDSYAARCRDAESALRTAGPRRVRLAKRTSNLFRDRAAQAVTQLDLTAFENVLEVNSYAGWVDVEGLTTYEALTDVTLSEGFMPAVVPELKTITIGGAAAGVGIEASSFRQGLVHESLLEADVLIADGSIVTATPDNQHAALFYALPNSYGTLGYALRLRARIVPVRPYVKVAHTPFFDAKPFFAALERACASDADFVDGVAFAPNQLVLNVARFVPSAPWTNDYGLKQIYYRSLTALPLDYLATRDYLWRWDTDWFWCSKNFGAERPWVRHLLGRERLGSKTYTRLMRRASRLGLQRMRDRLTRHYGESVIQDVDIPIDRAADFLAFLHRDIGIKPIWICPIRASENADRFTLFSMQPGELYINFGFWDRVTRREPHAPGHFNRLIEREVIAAAGIKSLYSDSYFERDRFYALYGGDDYAAVKAHYDPQGRFGDLYEKCVLRH